MPESEVETLVMKALSLGLVRGSIDQLDSKAHLDWVQPRVLSRDQLVDVHARLGAWIGSVEGLIGRMGVATPDLFVAS